MSTSTLKDISTSVSAETSEEAASTVSAPPRPSRPPLTPLEQEYQAIWKQFQELCTFDRITDPASHFKTALAHMPLNRYNNVLANDSTIFPPHAALVPDILSAPPTAPASASDLAATVASMSEFTSLTSSMSTASGVTPSPSVVYPYLNANLMDSKQLFDIPLNLVASQSPLPIGGQIAHWWAVIAQFRIPLVIMLTRVQEGNKIKAQPYWPKGDVLGTTLCLENGFNVTLVSVSRNEEYHNCVRLLEITGRSITGKPVKHFVEHFQYLGWPDFGIPEHFDDFQIIMDRLHHFADQKVEMGSSTTTTFEIRPTVVVHCSAGIGRTGTLMAAYVASVLQQRGTHTLSPEVLFEIVRRLKVCRTGMIQRPEQLHFLYKYLSLPVIPNSETTV